MNISQIVDALIDGNKYPAIFEELAERVRRARINDDDVSELEYWTSVLQRTCSTRLNMLENDAYFQELDEWR